MQANGVAKSWIAELGEEQQALLSAYVRRRPCAQRRCALPQCNRPLWAGNPGDRGREDGKYGTSTAQRQEDARIQRWSGKPDSNGQLPRAKEAFLVQRGLGSLGLNERLYPLRSHRSRGCFPSARGTRTGR
ncbi:hypothetical protein F5X99DRAFT_340729 [Biscogniauxia marginata]|nr:hypothetical protein F5X99DRAFT_340729 [Biscogniauxia marginata]